METTPTGQAVQVQFKATNQLADVTWDTMQIKIRVSKYKVTRELIYFARRLANFHGIEYYYCNPGRRRQGYFFYGPWTVKRNHIYFQINYEHICGRSLRKKWMRLFTRFVLKHAEKQEINKIHYHCTKVSPQLYGIIVAREETLNNSLNN